MGHNARNLLSDDEFGMVFRDLYRTIVLLPHKCSLSLYVKNITNSEESLIRNKGLPHMGEHSFEKYEYLFERIMVK